MRRAAKVDANQEAIVAALRAHGCSVQVLSAVGHGCPDLLAGWRGENWLFECKSQRDDRKKAPDLTADQVQWIKDWRGRVAVVLSPAEALAAIGVTA